MVAWPAAEGEDGGWVGRTAYWDGDPQRTGHRLFKLLQERRQGDVQAVLGVLKERDWAVINPELTAANVHEHKRQLEWDEELVEGVGVAYKEDPAFKAPMLHWREGEAMEDEHIQWIYTFEPEAAKMKVYEVARDAKGVRIPSLVGVVDLRGVEPNWGDIECGERMERCRHAAFVHAERLGIDSNHPSARLSLRQLLGQDELSEHDAVGAVHKGKHYAFTGNGRREADGIFYYEAVIDGVWPTTGGRMEGARTKLDITRPGVKLVFPKLRDELLRSGEMQAWPLVEKTQGGMEL